MRTPQEIESMLQNHLNTVLRLNRAIRMGKLDEKYFAEETEDQIKFRMQAEHLCQWAAFRVLDWIREDNEYPDFSQDVLLDQEQWGSNLTRVEVGRCE